VHVFPFFRALPHFLAVVKTIVLLRGRSPGLGCIIQFVHEGESWLFGKFEAYCDSGNDETSIVDARAQLTDIFWRAAWGLYT
jgi:hypothetical protein